ncbi:MAG: hypothetical protein HKP58_10320 [Desulfatitalea sp.]|nr:nucleotidyltransferase domain-containing protein [Desulfatitalea sp.]NNK00796.1 hypothetical protein [Desulfatitalea sp.]
MDLIVKMKFGAHLYGTADADSDMDYKGVYLPSRREVLLGNIPKCRRFATGDDRTKNHPGDIDEEIYSLHHFIQLSRQGQIVAMDMLHAPDEMLLVNSEPWQRLVRNRHRFYTKRLSAFVDYARRQAAKYGIKGSRLNAAVEVLAVLKQSGPEKLLRNIWPDLPRGEHCFDVSPAPTGISQYQMCGKTFQASMRVGHVIPIVERFYDTYGARAKLAAENKDIDWKAISHALRAAIQTREILTVNTIRYPLRDAPYLKAVKAGRLDYLTQVAPALETLIEQVQGLLDRSALPEDSDGAYWDRFICETLDMYRFGDP